MQCGVSSNVLLCAGSDGFCGGARLSRLRKGAATRRPEALGCSQAAFLSEPWMRLMTVEGRGAGTVRTIL